jgi:hypothetical protein
LIPPSNLLPIVDMKKISEYEAKYKLQSPDQRFYISYKGSESGMGSPTVGHISLWEKKSNAPIYSSPSWSEACFSDDSKYLIHARAGNKFASSYRALIVINCISGKEEWILENSNKDGSIEIQNRAFTFSVNGREVSSLQDFVFDISKSEIESN